MPNYETASKDTPHFTGWKNLPPGEYSMKDSGEIVRIDDSKTDADLSFAKLMSALREMV